MYQQVQPAIQLSFTEEKITDHRDGCPVGIKQGMTEALWQRGFRGLGRQRLRPH